MKQSPLLKLVQARGTSVALTTLRPLICSSLWALRSLVMTWLNPEATPPAWVKQNKAASFISIWFLQSYFFFLLQMRSEQWKKWFMHWEASQSNVLFKSADHRPDRHHCCWTLRCKPSAKSPSFKGFSDKQGKWKHRIYSTLPATFRGWGNTEPHCQDKSQGLRKSRGICSSFWSFPDWNLRGLGGFSPWLHVDGWTIPQQLCNFMEGIFATSESSWQGIPNKGKWEQTIDLLIYECKYKHNPVNWLGCLPLWGSILHSAGRPRPWAGTETGSWNDKEKN